MSVYFPSARAPVFQAAKAEVSRLTEASGGRLGDGAVAEALEAQVDVLSRALQEETEGAGGGDPLAERLAPLYLWYGHAVLALAEEVQSAEAMFGEEMQRVQKEKAGQEGEEEEDVGEEEEEEEDDDDVGEEEQEEEGTEGKQQEGEKEEDQEEQEEEVEEEKEKDTQEDSAVVAMAVGVEGSVLAQAQAQAQQAQAQAQQAAEDEDKELAWELLEVARVIYERVCASLTPESNKEEGKKSVPDEQYSEVLLDYAMACLRCGDVQVMNNNHGALDDYEKCIQLLDQSGKPQRDARFLDVYIRMSTAYLAHVKDAPAHTGPLKHWALHYYRKALASVNALVDFLQQEKDAGKDIAQSRIDAATETKVELEETVASSESELRDLKIDPATEPETINLGLILAAALAAERAGITASAAPAAGLAAAAAPFGTTTIGFGTASSSSSTSSAAAAPLQVKRKAPTAAPSTSSTAFPSSSSATTAVAASASTTDGSEDKEAADAAADTTSPRKRVRTEATEPDNKENCT